MNNSNLENKQYDPDIMREYRERTKRIYQTWAILTVVIAVGLLLLSYKHLILGFLLGSVVNAGLIGLVMYAFSVALKEQGNYRTHLTTGPLPKALLMGLGVVISIKFPTVFNTVGYVIGIAMYAIVFGINSFIEGKAKPTENSS